MRNNNALALKATNYVLYILLIITIVSCLTIEIIGDRYEQELIKEFNDFQRARSFIKNGQFENSSELLMNLLGKDRYKGSFPIILSYAVSRAGLGEYDEAYEYFMKAQEIRPLAILDYIYNVQVGEVLYQMGNYTESRVYLLRSRKINPDGQFDEIASNLLNEIQNKTDSKWVKE